MLPFKVLEFRSQHDAQMDLLCSSALHSDLPGGGAWLVIRRREVPTCEVVLSRGQVALMIAQLQEILELQIENPPQSSQLLLIG